MGPFRPHNRIKAADASPALEADLLEKSGAITGFPHHQERLGVLIVPQRGIYIYIYVYTYSCIYVCI